MNTDNKALHVTIYCDGACSGNGKETNTGGWGVVLMFKSQKKEICGGEKNTTNQRMELTACIKGLSQLKTNTYIVDIFSDSAYLINCMQRQWYKKWESNGWKTSDKKPVENKDLWLELLTLLKTYTIVFHKVKGHSDNPYNNRADELARQGIQEIKR